MKETLATAAEPIVETRDSASLKDFFSSLRTQQWTKNLVILAGLLCAVRLGDIRSILMSVAAFLDFCFLSGAVYLVNDVSDYEQDRFQPVKRLRPIASGRLSRSIAMTSG